MITDEKYQRLINYLRNLKSAVVAFSGGVDSTFLLRAAQEALGDNVRACTIISPYIPRWEIEEAKELVKQLGIQHEFIEVPIIDEIKHNPKDRCYLCKKGIFERIKEHAREKSIDFVLDGTNADDTKDYRPGIKALKELEIKSPLLENGLTKQEIRAFSKELGLETWDKPAYACLLSRIPYDQEITLSDLEKVESSERYLMSLGFKGVRVRSHGEIARIEIQTKDMKNLLEGSSMELISKKLKELGFRYVTLDMEGYKMGSLN